MTDEIMPFVPTDYSKSPMDPERIKILQAAERAYINGVPSEDGAIEWPTYRGLASQYAIPVRVINEQALKHRWNARRDRRKAALVHFKNAQMQRKWMDMDRQFTEEAAKAVQDLQFVAARKIYEMTKKAQIAIALDAQAADRGDYYEVNEMDVKVIDIKTMSSMVKDLNEAQAARANRAQALPMSSDEIATPAELPTADEEQALQIEASKAQLPDGGVMDIMKMMLELEQRAYDRLDRNQVIEGETADGDDDDGLTGVLVS